MKSEEPQRQFLSTQESTHTCFVCNVRDSNLCAFELEPNFPPLRYLQVQVLIDAFLISCH